MLKTGSCYVYGERNSGSLIAFALNCFKWLKIVKASPRLLYRFRPLRTPSSLLEEYLCGSKLETKYSLKIFVIFPNTNLSKIKIGHWIGQTWYQIGNKTCYIANLANYSKFYIEKGYLCCAQEETT